MTYNFPVKLELEMPDGNGSWDVTNFKNCVTNCQIQAGIDKWKSLYALNNKSYQIFVTTPSKANKLIKDIDISDII
jgi:hypothetical protein